jgi:hypothetical protein
MAQEELRPLEGIQTDPVGNFLLQCYLVRIECSCGHFREVKPAFIRKMVGEATTIGQMQLRFRCAKCARRGPQIRVYRLPR